MKRARIFVFVVAIVVCFIGCEVGYIQEQSVVSELQEQQEVQKQQASTTPFGKYPELITYTLGKMTGSNNSNMPVGDTYEDNAYTRYLKEMLNIQNSNTFEISDGYDTYIEMAINTNELPDIMVVSDLEYVEKLVELDLIEDLSLAYEQCASDRIKDIYDSYGDEIFDPVTFDGKLMALPETNIDDGPNMIWLRKDWMDALGLEDPKNLDDVEYIIKQFIEQDPGGNGAGETVGLVCDANLAGSIGYGSEYQVDMVFATYGAYPKQWIYNEDGEVVYGSIQKEAKEALARLNRMYTEGILDDKFLLRTSVNIIELIVDGKCGSFFGPWWTPNNPLMEAMKANPQADWQPYLIETDSSGVTSYYSQNPSYKYVVVRKGYEYPEIAVKIISTMFDYLRYQDVDNEEMIYYYQQNVDPTARPIAINIDYNDALDRCYENLTAAFEDEKIVDSLEVLEYSYYWACRSYIDNKEAASVEDWAAYTSRITASSLLHEAETVKITSLYFGKTETMKTKWWTLKELEKNTYLEIVTGVKELSYFEEFVEMWYENGGEEIEREVREGLGY